MKQNRADWKAKNYVKEYDAKMKKKAPREIQKEQRAKNYTKTLARAKRCQAEVDKIVRAIDKVFSLRSEVGARRDAIATVSLRAKNIQQLLSNIEQTCEKEHLQRSKN